MFTVKLDYTFRNIIFAGMGSILIFIVYVMTLTQATLITVGSSIASVVLATVISRNELHKSQIISKEVARKR